MEGRAGAPGEPRRAPPREADRSLRANKGPLCQLLCDRGFPKPGHWGTPRAGAGAGEGPQVWVPD